MDIYQYAKDIDYMADYMDPNTGYIYRIQNYGRAKKLGLPTYGIEVVDSMTGESLGYAQENED